MERGLVAAAEEVEVLRQVRELRIEVRVAAVHGDVGEGLAQRGRADETGRGVLSLFPVDLALLLDGDVPEVDQLAGIDVPHPVGEVLQDPDVGEGDRFRGGTRSPFPFPFSDGSKMA